LLLKPENHAESRTDVREGFLGRYGFYEAVDYTPTRLPRGQSNVIVRSFMSHHVGMSLLGLSGFLLGRPMQRRFESDASLQASLLLLQERVPRYTSFHSYINNEINVRTNVPTQEMPVRIYDTPSTPGPQVHLLSNDRYQVMISNAGGGYSKWNELAVTRWREDSTCDHWGNFCYIRDVESGYFWSTSFQPTLRPGDELFGRTSRIPAGIRNNAHTELSCLLKMMSNYAGCISKPNTDKKINDVPVMELYPFTGQPIPHLIICLSRPRSFTRGRQFFVHEGPGRMKRKYPGCFT
jgi:hypothetical protein